MAHVQPSDDSFQELIFLFPPCGSWGISLKPFHRLEGIESRKECNYANSYLSQPHPRPSSGTGTPGRSTHSAHYNSDDPCHLSPFLCLQLPAFLAAQPQRDCNQSLLSPPAGCGRVKRGENSSDRGGTGSVTSGRHPANMLEPIYQPLRHGGAS